MPGDLLRTFIAIELDRPVRTALARVQEKFKRQTRPGAVKWVAPDGIHLTLKFLGDTPAARVGAVRAALERACVEMAPFDFTVEGRGCYPNFRRPRVVWVAVHDRGAMLRRLWSAVEREVAPLGFPTEERGFSPHLTLGRLSQSSSPADAAALGALVEGTVVEQIAAQRVAGVSLIKSDLRPGGALYETLVTIPLVGSASGLEGGGGVDG